MSEKKRKQLKPKTINQPKKTLLIRIIPCLYGLKMCHNIIVSYQWKMIIIDHFFVLPIEKKAPREKKAN